MSATRSRKWHRSLVECMAMHSTLPFVVESNSSVGRVLGIVAVSWEFDEEVGSSRIFHHLAMESFRRRLSSIDWCMAKSPGSNGCGMPSFLAGRINLCTLLHAPFSLFLDLFFQRVSTIGGISSPCNVALWRKQERRKTAVLFSTHRVGRKGICALEKCAVNLDRKEIQRRAIAKI